MNFEWITSRLQIPSSSTGQEVSVEGFLLEDLNNEENPISIEESLINCVQKPSKANFGPATEDMLSLSLSDTAPTEDEADMLSSNPFITHPTDMYSMQQQQQHALSKQQLEQLVLQLVAENSFLKKQVFDVRNENNVLRRFLACQREEIPNYHHCNPSHQYTQEHDHLDRMSSDCSASSTKQKPAKKSNSSFVIKQEQPKSPKIPRQTFLPSQQESSCLSIRSPILPADTTKLIKGNSTQSHNIAVNINQETFNNPQNLILQIDLIGKSEGTNKKELRHYIEHKLTVQLDRNTLLSGEINIPAIPMNTASHNHGQQLFLMYSLMNGSELLSTIESAGFETITKRAVKKRKQH